MAERNAPPRQESEESLEYLFKRELAELNDVHAAQADELDRAFSPPVNDKLRQLSSDDSLYQNCISGSSSGAFADISETTGEITPISSPDNIPDHPETIKSVFKFLYDEFMPASKDQRTEKIRQFLGKVKEKASCIRLLPDGSSFMPDQNAPLQHCLTAVRTLKDVFGSTFESLNKFVKVKVPTGPSSGAGSSLFPGARQTREVFNPDPSGGTDQNVSARNPGVIVQNPMHDNLPRTRQQTSNVASSIQGNPTHPTSKDFFEVDQEEGAASKRLRYTKQGHVKEED